MARKYERKHLPRKMVLAMLRENKLAIKAWHYDKESGWHCIDLIDPMITDYSIYSQNGDCYDLRHCTQLTIGVNSNSNKLTLTIIFSHKVC